MKVLIVDNFDSFTYNLVQSVGSLGARVIVKRSNLLLSDLSREDPTHVIISPGPGTPKDSGVSAEAILYFAKMNIPVLGVCLGHQVIVDIFGGEVVMGDPVHGKAADINHDAKTIYRSLENPLRVGRYHSLIARSLPKALELTGWIGEEIMSVRHNDLPIEGVQFHPESILTPDGDKLIANFLNK